MPPIHVRSFEPLEALAAALGEFAAAAREALGQAEAAARRAAERLEEMRGDLEFEAGQLNDEYDSLDEDEDGGYLLARIDEVNEELNDLAAGAGRVDEAREVFRYSANELCDIVDDRIPAARAFLERKLDQLHAYVSFVPPIANLDAPVPAAPASSPSAVVAGTPLTAFRLPAGFTWVPLAEIEPTALQDADFRKVTVAEVEGGFDLLVGEVLPRLQVTPQADADLFAAADGAAGRDEAAGARRAFEAFFGDDPIRVERRVGAAVFEITNGRHRITVARRLRLTHVPANAVEVGG